MAKEGAEKGKAAKRITMFVVVICRFAAYSLSANSRSSLISAA